MRVLLIATTLATISAMPASGATDDAVFLAALEGSWSGRGEVRIRTDQPALRVNCDVNVDIEDTSFDMAGECGALFVTRDIGVKLDRAGEGYEGVYTGARSGPAQLTGALETDGFALDVAWGTEINGDETAEMTLSVEGADTLRLVTRDRDPESDELVVTSDIQLTRD